MSEGAFDPELTYSSDMTRRVAEIAGDRCSYWPPMNSRTLDYMHAYSLHDKIFDKEACFTRFT